MNSEATLSGNLRKMETRLEDGAHYNLVLDGTPIDMNARIGGSIKLSFDGTINCIACGRVTKKSFGGGFCFPCFRNAPEASECIIRPELCRAHEGEARDMIRTGQGGMGLGILIGQQSDVTCGASQVLGKVDGLTVPIAGMVAETQ